jgi:hypothetical protein
MHRPLQLARESTPRVDSIAANLTRMVDEYLKEAGCFEVYQRRAVVSG